MYSDFGEMRCDYMLGFHKMPKGYELWLNADRTHFYWARKADGAESAIHWNKWAVYRGAKENAKLVRQQAAESESQQEENDD